MKKLILSSLILTSVLAFAYTQTDVENATYLAGKGIITTQSTTAGYRLDDTITRAEVAGIALKLRGTTLPEGYTCKRYFGDAIRNDWICRAVELAADAGLVSRANTRFRPGDKITRAEAIAILMKAKNILIPSGATMPIFPYSDVSPSSWQGDVIFYAGCIGITENVNYAFVSPEGCSLTDKVSPIKFYPNRYATRAEVFGFAKNILEYKATMSGEVTIKNEINKTYQNSVYGYKITYPGTWYIDTQFSDNNFTQRGAPEDNEFIGGDTLWSNYSSYNNIFEIPNNAQTVTLMVYRTTDSMTLEKFIESKNYGPHKNTKITIHNIQGIKLLVEAVEGLPEGRHFLFKKNNKVYILSASGPAIGTLEKMAESFQFTN